MLETETLSPLDQLRQRWENLNKDQSTKLQLSLNSLEQDQLSPVHIPYIVIFLFFNKCFVFNFDLYVFLVSHFSLLYAGPPQIPYVQSQCGV